MYAILSKNNFPFNWLNPLNRYCLIVFFRIFTFLICFSLKVLNIIFLVYKSNVFKESEKCFLRDKLKNRKNNYQVFEYFSSVSRSSGIKDVEAGEEILAEVDEVLVASLTSGLSPIVAQHAQQNKLHLKILILIFYLN